MCPELANVRNGDRTGLLHGTDHSNELLLMNSHSMHDLVKENAISKILYILHRVVVIEGVQLKGRIINC